MILDGREGLSRAGDDVYDLVILDVLLPGLSGVKIAQQLRADGNDVPILMLTARDAAGDVVAGLDAGADDYVTKPFAFDVLVARVRSLIRRAADHPSRQFS